MQLGKRAGMAPRQLAELLAGRLEARRRRRRGRDRGPGLPQPHRRGGGAGRGGPSRGRGGTRRTAAPTPSRARASTWSSSPRTRPGPSTSGAPAGPRGRRRDRPGPRGDRRRRHPRVLHQRPRRADRPVRRLAARRGARPAGPRRRLPAGSTSPTSPRSVLADVPTRLGPARAGAAGGLPRARRTTCMLAEQQAEPGTSSGPDSTSGSPRVAARVRRRGAGRRAAARSRAHVYEADGALVAAHHGLRRRQGPRAASSPTAELPTSPATLAYYLDKRERGFDRCLYLLGADHHGYVGRLRRWRPALR